MIFTGRSAELSNFSAWVARDLQTTGESRAALLVGSAGAGKTALVGRFEETCISHEPEHWYVYRAEVNANESGDEFFERLLHDTHKLLGDLYLARGPRDARLKKALYEILPSVGKLMATLAEEAKRPPWLRFVDYVRAVDGASARTDDRLVFLVDPDMAIGSGQAEEWLTVASKLPVRIRLVIAQRPDDIVAAHPESRRRFFSITGDQTLRDLDRNSVSAWYETEMAVGRLVSVSESWDLQTRAALPQIAYDRYRGFAFAHDAVIRFLAAGGVGNPTNLIQTWPNDVSSLMESAFHSLAFQGEERLRAALVLQVIALPTPRSLLAQAAGLSPEYLVTALNDARFGQFFTVADASLAFYHPLFAERLERELQTDSALTDGLARKVWEVIEPALSSDKRRPDTSQEFNVMAAGNVVLRFGDSGMAESAVDRVVPAKMRLGLYASAEADLDRLRHRFEYSAEIQALSLEYLGRVYAVKRSLKDAEGAYLEALERYAALGRDDRMARAYNGLGTVYRRLGKLDRAEEVYNKALEILEKLGRVDRAAVILNGLGLVYRTRGLLADAQQAYEKALTMLEVQGRLHDLAGVCNNLGVIYRRRGDFALAKQMHCRALHYYQRLEEPKGVADSYGNLGTLFKGQGDLTDAERRYRDALVIFEQLDHQEGKAHCYNNLALVYTERKDYEEAARLQLSALEIYRAIRQPEGVSDSYGNLGIIYLARGEYERAERMQRRALRIHRMIGSDRGVADAYANLGEVLKARGDLILARQACQKAVEILERLGYLEELADTYVKLGHISEAQGETSAAQEAMTKALDLYIKIGAQGKVEELQRKMLNSDQGSANGLQTNGGRLDGAGR